MICTYINNDDQNCMIYSCDVALIAKYHLWWIGLNFKYKNKKWNKFVKAFEMIVLYSIKITTLER